MDPSERGSERDATSTCNAQVDVSGVGEAKLIRKIDRRFLSWPSLYERKIRHRRRICVTDSGSTCPGFITPTSVLCRSLFGILRDARPRISQAVSLPSQTDQALAVTSVSTDPKPILACTNRLSEGADLVQHSDIHYDGLQLFDATFVSGEDRSIPAGQRGVHRSRLQTLRWAWPRAFDLVAPDRGPGRVYRRPFCSW